MILDGSKVSDKIAVIKALVGKVSDRRCDAARLLQRLGIATETSRLEADRVDLAKELLALELRGVAALTDR